MRLTFNKKAKKYENLFYKEKKRYRIKNTVTEIN